MSNFKYKAMHSIIKNKQRGLIRTLILIFIAILILSFLGIDIRETVESEMAQRNIGYVKATLISIWERYLEAPVMYIWNLFVENIWEPIVSKLDGLREEDVSPIQFKESTLNTMQPAN